MRPTDLEKLRIPSDPRFHPDGRRIAFTVSRPEVEEDRYVREVWLWDGDEARPFTHGPSDGGARWSPDGRWLAFLRQGEKDDAKPQVVVMPADGGEAQTITDLPLGVAEVAWSPASDRLVVVAPEWVEDLKDLDDKERARRPRRITEIPYRADNEGWTHDKRTHLWIVDPTGEQDPRQVTDGPYDDEAPAWRPDGRAIAFLSRRHEDRETDPGAGVFELDLDEDEVTELVAPGMWGRPAYGPGGDLHLVGLEDVFRWPSPPRLYRRGEDGGLTDLTAGLDRDVAGPDGGAPLFTDNDVLLVGLERGRAGVVVADADGARTLIGGDRTVTGAAATPDGRAVAFTVDDPTDPGELVLWEDGDERVLTELNAGFRSEVEVVPTEHFTYDRDGAEIDAWALVPEGDDVPLLLNIHGGPTAQYGFTFFDEFQVYAGAGYAVVGVNPRGSSGRGDEWARAVVGAWTEHESVDMLDVRASVDAMLERYPNVSRERIGIMGGSYGGYATARILAQEDRFRSAVVERGLLAWTSFSGTSDIAAYFDRMFLQKQLPGHAEDLWRASPVSTAHRITTPTLVLHSEQDLRCPIEQAEQLFTALRRAGVESEFLRFPGESHELSRSGKPKHRVERFEAIIDWHDRHLDVERPAGREADES